jgi:hypothetical protein
MIPMDLDFPRTPSFTLPIQLSSGHMLTQLELECRTCAQPYRLKQGYGRTGAPGGRVVLAARAHCPRCDEVARFFVVMNKVSKQAKIQRVSVINFWIAQQFLRFSRLRLTADAPQVQPTAKEMTTWVTRSKKIIGRYLDEDIPAWIDLENSRWHFVGIHPTSSTPVRLGEVVIHPGLLYRKGINTRV